MRGGLTFRPALVFFRDQAEGHRFLLTEAVPQDVMRLDDIGPARLRMSGAFLCRQTKKPFQVGQEPGKGQGKGRTFATRYYSTPFCGITPRVVGYFCMVVGIGVLQDGLSCHV